MGKAGTLRLKGPRDCKHTRGCSQAVHACTLLAASAAAAQLVLSRRPPLKLFRAVAPHATHDKEPPKAAHTPGSHLHKYAQQ